MMPDRRHPAPDATDVEEPTPAVARWLLRTRLRRLREQRMLTQEQVAKKMDWSLSKVIRIESGAIGVSVNDMRALLAVYLVNYQAQVDELRQLVLIARSRQDRRIFQMPPSVRAVFEQVAHFERSATVIDVYAATWIPDLLQTREYAAYLAPLQFASQLVADDVATSIIQRQEWLARRAGRVQTKFLIQEAVLHRQVGGSSVLAGQLGRLLESPSVRVIPGTAAARFVAAPSFAMMTIGDHGTLAFVHGFDGSVNLVEEPERLIHLQSALSEAGQFAADATTSSRLIKVCQVHGRS
ncbi:Scr1 family TA system antitoxin-like transcriptional regulator [Micromonospora sp. DT15]|uniref:Scr1 family TA system antitoxin-like transcriptional regulator n=1 Tax=Micromonospora sp. DT15 TaxID=3393445 RepID=UPI003CF57525